MFHLLISASFLVVIFASVNGTSMTRSEGGCSVSYGKIGCFKDKRLRLLRPMKQMLFTDRDKKSSSFRDTSIDWDNWGSYLPALVCRCAEAAAKDGFTTFAIQYYGECWAGSGFHFNRDGPSENCVNEKLKPCNVIASQQCAGKASAMFVYNIVP